MSGKGYVRCEEGVPSQRVEGGGVECPVLPPGVLRTPGSESRCRYGET